MTELLARLRAVMRRIRPSLADDMVTVGDIELDRVARVVGQLDLGGARGAEGEGDFFAGGDARLSRGEAADAGRVRRQASSSSASIFRPS